MSRIEAIAEDLENQMRKGFIGIIILHMLREEPSHSYKIYQNISDHTNGVWTPHIGSIYNSIKKLKIRGLIIVSKVESVGRKTKTYKITEDGERALDIAADKLKDLLRSMRSILISIFGLPESYATEDPFWG